MKNTLETRVFGAVELRVDGEGDTRMLRGHAAVFNSFSLDMGFREIIKPGAVSYPDHTENPLISVLPPSLSTAPASPS